MECHRDGSTDNVKAGQNVRGTVLLTMWKN